MQRLLLSVALAFLVALPAAAAEGHGEAKKDKKLEPGTTVPMPFLVAPMNKDGQLQGFAYISSKLVCSSPSACIDVRDKVAFIQDAYVREVYSRSAAMAGDPTKIDKDVLAARLTADAKRIVGDKKVVGITFVEIKYAPLHPSGSTDGAVVPPDQAAPPAEETKPEGEKGKESDKSASKSGH